MQEHVEESLWFVNIAKLWTHVVDSKKQASKGLEKIVDDSQQWFVHQQSKMNQNENDFIFYIFSTISQAIFQYLLQQIVSHFSSLEL